MPPVFPVVQSWFLFKRFHLRTLKVSDFSSMGKWLIVAGVVLALLGGFFLLFDKIPFLGKLPGDIRVEKRGFSFYFPVVTCLLLSVVVSLILWIFSKFK